MKLTFNPQAFQHLPRKVKLYRELWGWSIVWKGCTCSSSVPERTVFLLQCSQDPVGLLHDWSVWHDSVLHLDPGSSSSQAQVFPISKDWKCLTLISGCQALFFPLHCPGRFSSAQYDIAFYKRKLGLWLRKVLRPIYYLIILWMYFIGKRVVSLGPVLASLAFSYSSYLLFLFLLFLFLSTFSFLLLQKQTRNTTCLERWKSFQGQC